MKTPAPRDSQPLPLADIVVGSRLRPVTETGVTSLLQSIAELGVMKDAVHVRKCKDGTYRLIAGAHRMEAARRMGWSTIRAIVWTYVTDDWASLMEVDDNIAGAELNPMDTAVFLAARKRLYEKMYPGAKARQGAALVAGRWNTADIVSVVSFAKATAEKFGIDERHVRRLVAAGEGLSASELDDLRAAPRQVTLKDLSVIAKMGAGDGRSRVISALAEGKAKSAQDAQRALAAPQTAPVSKTEAEFKALVTAWNRAGAKAKKRFLLEMSRDVWRAQNQGVSLDNWAEAE